MLKVFQKHFFTPIQKGPGGSYGPEQEMLKSAYDTQMYPAEFVLGNCIFVKVYKKRLCAF